MNHTRLVFLASSVATLFAATGCSSEESSTTGQTAQAQSVRCVGVNSCKGTSECQSSDGKSACQGANECKGQGWITIPSEKECLEKGGTLYKEQQASKTGEAKPQSAVACEGINACKGQGACQGEDHACKGHNGCKGQGWIEVPSSDECTDKGGTVKGA